MVSELREMVVGKKMRDCVDVDFRTCYPVVARRATHAKNPTIIGVVCSEDGSHSEYYGEFWETDGDVAWFVPDE